MGFFFCRFVGFFFFALRYLVLITFSFLTLYKNISQMRLVVACISPIAGTFLGEWIWWEIFSYICHRYVFKCFTFTYSHIYVKYKGLYGEYLRSQFVKSKFVLRFMTDPTSYNRCILRLLIPQQYQFALLKLGNVLMEIMHL